jgi:hypothetical protein
VFTVREHHGTYFHYGLQDLWVGARTPVNAAAVVSLKILKAGKPHLEIADRPELQGRDVEYRGSGLSVVYPWSAAPKPVDVSFLTEYVRSFGSLGEEVAVEAEPKDLARFGLDHPSWELVVSDGEQTLHLVVGTDDGTYVFLRHAGDPMVYAIDRRIIDLLGVEPFRFVSKFAAVIKIDRVDRLDLAAGGSRHALEIRRPTAGSEEGASWLVDGKPVEAKAFKNFYTLLASMQIDSLHAAKLEEKPEATFTYTLNSGTVRTFRVTFVPYSQEFYALFKNGKSDILVNRQQLKVILQELEKLVQSAGG